MDMPTSQSLMTTTLPPFPVQPVGKRVSSSHDGKAPCVEIGACFLGILRSMVNGAGGVASFVHGYVLSK